METCCFRESLAASSFITRKKHFGDKKVKRERAQRANENSLPGFWSYSSCGRCSSLFILKSAVGVIRILKKTCKTKWDYIYHFLILQKNSELLTSLK